MLAPDRTAMTLLLGALVATAPLAMDIYLPSMPAMTRALGATADEVQLTLSVYMFGWGVAQLLAGPLSDRFGRRPAVVGGLVVFTLASVASAVAPSLAALIAARFFQAIAVAVVAVVPRAIVRDLHDGEKAAHTLSTMMLVLGVMPVVAPILGAELHLAFGWRANFAVVALYGAALLALVLLALPETLAQPDASALAPAAMLRNWRRALDSRVYVGYTIAIAAAMSGLFAFLAGSAFVFVEAMGRGERTYSLYFALVMIGTFAGTAVSRRVIRHIGIVRMVRAGTLALLGSGIAMAALAWLDVAHPLAVVVPMFLFMASYMCTVPQATAGALTPFPEIAGSAASLMQFVQFVTAASTALVVGLAFDGTARPMASAIALAGLVAFLAVRRFVSDRSAAAGSSR